MTLYLCKDTQDARDRVEAVFSYGTLRGDYNAKGDRWGVIGETHATWVSAWIRGFKVYQNPKRTYPFAFHTAEEDDILHGTLVRWPGEPERRIHGLDRMDYIEGFDPESPESGLYKRAVISATEHVVDAAGGAAPVVVEAFIYFQEWPPERLVRCICFQKGDWIRSFAKVDRLLTGREAVFAYGALRGDYSKHADRWNIIRGSFASWTNAKLRGFKLYEDPESKKPFAVRTGVESDVVMGTLIAWPGERQRRWTPRGGSSKVRKGLTWIHELEGFDVDCPAEGTCRRSLMPIEVLAGPTAGLQDVLAYVFHQDLPAEQLARCTLIASGDWLPHRKGHAPPPAFHVGHVPSDESSSS